jgi:hypothetical protein
MAKASFIMSIVALSLSTVALALVLVDFILKIRRIPYIDGSL